VAAMATAAAADAAVAAVADVAAKEGRAAGTKKQKSVLCEDY
jgi:hypothetical protein